ncbi:tRNA (adenosine(37)-N6)-threonylcarbamoyltransferase complex ATPase subunit type 1 TsaE [candidate division KSB1 bacterium]|nr:tRNA (adenosine(37)-N6)-threonylcarbamoyltransferase complex ATPase subunit type 1 TsaE [candidate division KSB1 bacterium]NIR70682.1 tRNA (adenosine(37)-N6)-threonylcarbamoyltransferase complex ATPase subunit type 1 TsaE [candidate division KSB1 bacterium]NIS26034.1 tRNA (adenosine(37)-N6)-threonylcarbamoyltransferase complex ATPase subunit type 1 TsaE [candidate division KSB1 bacterium]NIU26699.1 tRNA (adenosine(37)-N6)-threonylcarbamoyltransferase complex ATPase subunit type 1 TsaE [candid
MSVVEQEKTSFEKLRPNDSQRLISNSAEETENIGEVFAESLKSGDVVALFGELGSGKTTFIKGVCRGLEVSDDVTSPTFTLIHEYSGRLPVYHLDFYRLEDPREIWELGCEEYFYGEGVSLVEWANRIIVNLPKDRIEVHFRSRFQTGAKNTREILIKQR